MTEYRGVLHFHSETGTEGGHWAMQDERFMGLVDEQTMNTYRCPRCSRVWDKTRDAEEPKPSFTYYRPDWEEDGKSYIGGYFSSDHPIEGGQTTYRDEPEGSFNDEWTKRSNATSLECYENGHAEWELLHPDGVWSYEGLHVLRDGDHLTVYDPDDKERVVWEGEIHLKRHPLFTEDANGMWIHADQKGVDREEWAQMFFKGYPCKLVTKENA